MDDQTLSSAQVMSLRRRFAPELHRQKGHATYVPAAHIIGRLNDVLGVSGWTWEWIWKETPSEILVDGTLTIGSTQSRGIDVHPILKAQSRAEALANAIKGAESGALVRAARRFGVGLYLWADGGKVRLECERGVAGDASPPKSLNASCSKDQARRISELQKRLGWTNKQLLKAAQCTMLRELSAKRADEVIADLEKHVGELDATV